MKSFWTKKKECATCEYWDGPRQITHNPDFVECENALVMGTCCGVSHNRGKQVMAGQCSGGLCWRCWHCLKE